MMCDVCVFAVCVLPHSLSGQLIDIDAFNASLADHTRPAILSRINAIPIRNHRGFANSLLD